MIFPTKSNLINLKKAIKLSSQGQQLLEKKKVILVKEREKYIDKRNKLKEIFDSEYKLAFNLLKSANIDIGLNKVNNIAKTMKVYDKINIKYKTVMGVEIPILLYEKYINNTDEITFELYDTTISLDETIIQFQKLREILIELTELEIVIERLDEAIEKVQRRSNSLKEIIIPKYIKDKKYIEDTLEEREREEFSRLKRLKK